MSLFVKMRTNKRYSSLEEEEQSKASSAPLLNKQFDCNESQVTSPQSRLLLERSYKLDAKPSNTEEYVVKEGDTLAKIAAKFWTTPALVRRLNKLYSNNVFTGQTLLVPKLRRSENE